MADPKVAENSTTDGDLPQTSPSYLNSTFIKDLKEQCNSMLTSPIITKKVVVPQENLTCSCSCSLGTDKVLLSKMASLIEGKVKEYLNSERLDSLIDSKFNEFLNSSVTSNNESRVDRLVEHKLSELNATNISSSENSQKPLPEKEIMERLNKLHEELQTSNGGQNAKIDKLETGEDSLKMDVKLINENIECIRAQLIALRSNVDENIARDVKKGEEQDKRLNVVETQVAENKTSINVGEQYGRRETVEFHNIPYENEHGRPENCYNIIIGFLRIHYGIFLERRDISVCHRQIIPSEKKKFGRDYIAPIYCKFVNRYNAQYILDERECLRNCTNVYGQPLFVRENLTFSNKILLDSAQSDLNTFKFKYISNWKIFVKKDFNTKPIRIKSEGVLSELVHNERISQQPTPSVANDSPLDNQLTPDSCQAQQEPDPSNPSDVPTPQSSSATYDPNWRFRQSHNHQAQRSNRFSSHRGFGRGRYGKVLFRNYRSHPL